MIFPSIDRIAKANRLDLKRSIQPGQKLVVPVKVRQGEAVALKK